MDRERQRLENEEQKIIREIKKMAKEGQMVRLRACARSRVSPKPVPLTRAHPHVRIGAHTRTRSHVPPCTTHTRTHTHAHAHAHARTHTYARTRQGAAKIQAKNLVRTRNYITKFIKMRAQLQAVSLRIVTLKSTQSMSDAMRGVVKVRGRVVAGVCAVRAHVFVCLCAAGDDDHESASQSAGDAARDDGV